MWFRVLLSILWMFVLIFSTGNNFAYSEFFDGVCDSSIDKIGLGESKIYLLYDKTRVREGPGTRYGVCYEFVGNKGMPLVEINRVEDIQTQDDGKYWILVQDWKNRLGWIHYSQVTERGNSLVVLRSADGDINLYNVPNYQGEVVFNLPEGTMVNLLSKCKRGWCHIRVREGHLRGGLRGWVGVANIWR